LTEPDEYDDAYDDAYEDEYDAEYEVLSYPVPEVYPWAPPP
jgi:hypothetical protein